MSNAQTWSLQVFHVHDLKGGNVLSNVRLAEDMFKSIYEEAKIENVYVVALTFWKHVFWAYQYHPFAFHTELSWTNLELGPVTGKLGNTSHFAEPV